MLLINMLDPPGGKAILEAPGINKKDDHGLQESGAPERMHATGWRPRSGKQAGSLREP